MRDNLKLLANIEIIVTRNDSPYVSFNLEETRELSPIGMMDNDDCHDRLQEDLGLIATNQIDLPDEVKKMSFDDMATISGEFWGDYFSYETDYGTEYDAKFEIRNATVKIEPFRF